MNIFNIHPLPLRLSKIMIILPYLFTSFYEKQLTLYHKEMPVNGVAAEYIFCQIVSTFAK